MRGISLSDTHLGKSQFARTENGRNARQCDIERAWFRAIDVIADQQPDLVVIPGDVFDTVRPPLHAVKAYRDGLRRIVDETEAYVVVIPGNHDASKTAETLSPVVIPDDLPRVHVVTSAQWLLLFLANGESAAVLCVPHDNLGAVAAFDPAGAPGPADVRGLVIHAAVKSSVGDDLPVFYAGDLAVDVGMLAEQFDFVACGDFHEYRRLHPDRLAFYSGATERTSSNFWPEAEVKGVVLFDTDARSMELRPIPTRPMFDYTLDDVQVRIAQPTADTVNHALGQILGVPEHHDAIVRLVVDDLPRDEYPLIDRALTAELRQKCFAWQLDVHFAERELTSASRAASSLDDAAAAWFAEDPEPVRETALAYLREGRAA